MPFPLLSLLLLLPPCNAATLSVCPSPGPSCAYTSLSAALTQAADGDAIHLSRGLYNNATAHCGNLVHGDKAVSIVGNASVVDCQGAAFFLHVDDDGGAQPLSLSDLAIRNCTHTRGSALSASDVDLHVSNVTIHDCSVSGASFGEEGVGVIYLAGTSSTFTDVTLRDAQATFGPLFVFGEDTSVFTRLHLLRTKGVEFGGGVLVEGPAASSPLFVNSTFEACESPFGGAVDTGGFTQAEFRDSLFVNNRGQRGGAVYHFGDDRLRFVNCTFLDNTATNSGGAVEVSTRTQPSYTGCRFVGNTALGNGGAVRVTGGAGCAPSFSHCLWERNAVTSGSGGAVSCSTPAVVNITGSAFTDNAAQNVGGCLESQNIATMNVKDSTFTRCSASEGGALFSAAPSPTWYFDNVTVEDCTAVSGGGGFLLAATAHLVCTNCTLTRSSSSSDGGALLSRAQAGITLVGGRVTENRAARRGGGFAVFGSGGSYLTDVVVEGNAAASGAGLYAVGAMSATSCLIARNTASENGAGVVVQPFTTSVCGSIALQHTAFVGNVAAGGGGGMYMSWEDAGLPVNASTGTVDLCFAPCDGCTFSGNSALYGTAQGTPPLSLAPVSSPATVQGGSPFTVEVAVLDGLSNTVFGGAGLRVGATVANTSGCTMDAAVASVSGPSAVLNSLSLSGPPSTACTIVMDAEPKTAGLPLPTSVAIVVLACGPGFSSSTGSSFSCSPCAPGTFNLVAGGECMPCPRGIVCSGSTSVSTQSGWWPSIAADNSTLEAYRCPGGFCDTDDGSERSLWQRCPEIAVTRTGLLCGECPEGTVVGISSSCIECDRTNPALVAVLVAAIVAFTMINIVIGASTKSDPTLSQLTFFSQTLVVVASSVRRVGVDILNLFGNLNVYSIVGILDAFGSGGSLADGCIAAWSPLAKAASRLILPGLLWGCMGLFGVFHMCIVGWRNVNPLRYGSASFRLLLLSYALVSDVAVDIVMCRRYGSELVMASEPAVECYAGAHLPMAILAWALVVFWVLGVPVAIAVFLVRHRKRKTLDHKKHGLLYTVFRPELYLSRPFLLARRSLVVVVSSATATLESLRLYVLAHFMLLFLVALLTLRPYRRLWFNLMEATMLLLLVMVTLAQLGLALVPTGQTASAASLDREFLDRALSASLWLSAVWVVAALLRAFVVKRDRLAARLAAAHEPDAPLCSVAGMRVAWLKLRLRLLCVCHDGRARTGRRASLGAWVERLARKKSFPTQAWQAKGAGTVVDTTNPLHSDVGMELTPQPGAAQQGPV